MHKNASCLLALLGGHACSSVGDLNVENLSALEDSLTGELGATVSDLSSIGAVEHEEKLQIGNIVHDELFEAIGQHVPGLLVGTVTNVWHQHLSLELTADTGINTLWPPPAFRYAHERIGLVALELVGLLLDDLWAGHRNGHG